MERHSGTCETFSSKSEGLILKLAVRPEMSDGMFASKAQQPLQELITYSC